MSNLKPLDDPITDPESVDLPSIAAPSAYPKQKKLKPRGRPFQPGECGNRNGRPRGSLNKATLFGQQLIAGQVETIFERLFVAIEDGDTVTARFCAARLVPRQRSRYISLELPDINSRADLEKAANAVWAACSKGEISLEDAELLMSVLRVRGQLFDAGLADRLTELEQLFGQISAPKD